MRPGLCRPGSPPLLRRAWPLVPALLAISPAAAQERPEASREALEERVRDRTFREQGGRSHASGERPEMGPLSVRSLLSAPVTTIRVGLTPTSFAADGSVLLEYLTAAAHHHDRVEVTATGAFELVEASGNVVFAGSGGQAVSFMKTSDRAAIAVSASGESLGSFPGPLRLRATGEGSILIVNSMRRINRLAPLVNGMFQLTPPPYRGELEVLASASDPSRLRLVNVVELEDYVPGVVVNESLATFHVEALKAQAITARGYAAANVGRFAERGFDIDDSTLSQVYRGQSSETPVALQAAQDTLGLVVTREGRILSALYSSSMGGHTENNEYVFPAGGYPGANADPALRGIHDGEEPLAVDLASENGVRLFYSTVYPGSYEVNAATGAPLTSLHRWTRTRSAAELLARLKESFSVPASARTLTDIRTVLRGVSGRMMQVVVSGDWGATTISGWSDLRRLATLSGVTPGGTAATSAPNSPSTHVITRDPAGNVQEVLFYGGGFGHNVGMSQYGAHGRALRGQSAYDILTGYYTGAEVTTAPLLVSAAPLPEQRFLSPDGRAVLVVENHGAHALMVQVNGRRFVLSVRPDETVEVDLSPYLVEGTNRISYAVAGTGGSAVVRVRVSAPREAERRRHGAGP